jgi:hypothetical protein
MPHQVTREPGLFLAAIDAPLLYVSVVWLASLAAIDHRSGASRRCGGESLVFQTRTFALGGGITTILALTPALKQRTAL